METKKENKVKTVMEAVAITLLYLLIQLAVSIIISLVVSLAMSADNMDKEALLNSINAMQPLMLFISNLICTVLFGIWYYLGYVRKDKLAGTYEPWHEKMCDAKVIAFIVFSSLAIGLFDRHIADLIIMISPESGELLSTIMSNVSEVTPMNITSMVILSAMATAFVFPGIIMQKFKKSFGMAACIIIPAILFAVLMLNPVQTIYGIPFGLVMMFISYKFNSVVPGMLVILINNIGAILLNQIFSPGLPPVVSACCVVVFLALSIFMYRKMPFSSKDTKDIPSQNE